MNIQEVVENAINESIHHCGETALLNPLDLHYPSHLISALIISLKEILYIESEGECEEEHTYWGCDLKGNEWSVKLLHD
jgi:hypothetical protein